MSKAFQEWIETVEVDSQSKVTGLRHCSLEHRSALLEAFNAGVKAEHGKHFDKCACGSTKHPMYNECEHCYGCLPGG